MGVQCWMYAPTFDPGHVYALLDVLWEYVQWFCVMYGSSHVVPCPYLCFWVVFQLLLMYQLIT